MCALYAFGLAKAYILYVFMLGDGPFSAPGLEDILGLIFARVSLRNINILGVVLLAVLSIPCSGELDYPCFF